jgi:hypothetical protein
LPKGYGYFQATPHGQILPIAAKILKQDTLAQPGAFEDFVKGRSYVIIEHKLRTNFHIFTVKCSKSSVPGSDPDPYIFEPPGSGFFFVVRIRPWVWMLPSTIKKLR